MGASRLMAPPRFVIDTNVVVGTLIFRSGRLAWLREAWRAQRVVPLASEATVAEFARVLSYSKFGLSPEERIERLFAYLPWCETVDVSDDTSVPECRDPSDRPFLQLAVASQADALVTEDRDLLSLAPVFGIPILTANEAQERLADS